MVKKSRNRNGVRNTTSSTPASSDGKVLPPTYVLRLYVTGTTTRATLAIRKIKQLCEEHLKGRYALEVVDVYQQPELLRQEQIIAAPTLIKKLPLPLRRLVGDFSDKKRVLNGLDLIPRAN
jgi:circadian clock protein KaiB